MIIERKPKQKIYMRCECCGKEFVARRKTAKYCSDKCKMEFREYGSRISQKLLEAKRVLREAALLFEANPAWADAKAYELLKDIQARYLEADMAHLEASKKHGQANLQGK